MLGEPFICSTSIFVICHQPSINLMSLLPLVLSVVSELYVILSPVSEEGRIILPARPVIVSKVLVRILVFSFIGIIRSKCRPTE